MRGWALLAACLAASLGRAEPPNANPVLVLLPPASTGPNPPPGSYRHDAWVRWPPTDGVSGNRLLSLVTGADWIGDPRDYDFRATEEGDWRASALTRLRERGHFEAKHRALGMPTAALQTSGSNVPSVLLAAVDRSGTVTPVPIGDRWPAGTLMIFGAHGWDEVALVRKATRGRIAVVEYPPPKDANLSRLWLYGPWPLGRTDLSGTLRPALPGSGPVPGLLEAREVGPLLAGTSEVDWTADPGDAWPGAKEWHDLVAVGGPIARGVWGAILFLALVLGLRYVADERRSRRGAELLEVAAIVPLAVMVTGTWLRWGSYSVGGAAALFLILPLLLGLSRRLRLKLPPLAATGWTIWAGALAATPTFSPFSGPLDLLAPSASPEGLGYLYLGIALAASARRTAWPVAIGVGATLLLGIAGVGWWAPAGTGLVWLPVAAFAAGRGRLRIWMAPIAWAMTDGLPIALTHGLAYRPGGLANTWLEWQAHDLGIVLRFLISPAVLVTGLLLGAAALWVPGFAVHQLRKVWLASTVPPNLGRMAGFFLVLGLFQPPLCDVAWVVGVGFAIVLLMEALWFSPAIT
jgi:hypothetical protein